MQMNLEEQTSMSLIDLKGISFLQTYVASISQTVNVSLDTTIFPVFDRSGVILLSERERLQRRIDELEERGQHLQSEVDIVRQVSESSHTCDCRWDFPNHTITLLTPWLFWYKGDEIILTLDEWIDRIHPNDKERFRREINEHREKNDGEIGFTIEYRVRKTDDQYIWIRSWFKDVETGKTMGRHTDITSLIEHKEKAHQDALTQLPNRRMAFVVLDERIVLGKKFVFLYMDLNGFKRVNDTHGHAVGDLLLQWVAERLRSILRWSDFVARLWWDEFCVVMEGKEDQEDIVVVVRKIQNELKKPYSITTPEMWEKTIRIGGVSIGIALFPDHGKTKEDIMINADCAMYDAKKWSWKRENYVFFHTEMRQEEKRIAQLKQDIEIALDIGNDFNIMYQHIVDSEGKSQFVEAHLEWMHPSLWSIGHEELMTLAESAWCTEKFGKYFLTEVASQLNKCDNSVCPRISINVTARQLWNKAFLDTFLNVCEIYSLDTGRFGFEITEEAIGEKANIANVSKYLLTFQWLGISITLDRYGTGALNIALLANFPINFLKLDRSFIRWLQHESDWSITQNQSYIFCNAMINLGLNLGKKVIADGVETEEQFHILQQLWCHYFQGELFGSGNFNHKDSAV